MKQGIRLPSDLLFKLLTPSSIIVTTLALPRDICRENPPHYLMSNFDLDFLSDIYLGLNLIRLDLRMDVNF